jgi:hypothetical protein
VVGYIALFLVLSGGSAYALTGSNTVFSDDIVDGEVRTADIADASVGTEEVINQSLSYLDVASDSIYGFNIHDESVGGPDIATNGVGPTEIRDNSVGLGEIVAGGVGTAEIVNGSVRPEDTSVRPAARVWRDSLMATPESTQQDVVFNKEIYDTYGLFDPSAPDRLTAPIAGYYYIQGDASIKGELFSVALKLDGTTVAQASSNDEDRPTHYEEWNVSTLIRMNAGQTVRLSYATGNVRSATLGSFPQSSPVLSMHWVGPL